MKNCIQYKQIFSWMLLISMMASGLAKGMPERKPVCLSITSTHARELTELTNEKEKQAYAKQMDENRKNFYREIVKSKWVGGKKISSMPDFYLLWTPAYDEPERLKEALKFMYKLQPKLKREFGVFLVIRLYAREDEKKILSAMSSAGVSLPVYNNANFPYPGTFRSLEKMYLFYPSGRYSKRFYLFAFPYSELDDSEAEDVYMSAIQNVLKRFAEERGNALGRSFLSRYMSTYMRSHFTEIENKL